MDLKEHVQIVGKYMLEIVIRGLKSGNLAIDRAREIARFYLNKIRNASSEEELQHDLDIMEQELPEMKDVVMMEKARNKETQEKQIKNQVEELLKQGKVDEAAALAKQVSGSQ